MIEKLILENFLIIDIETVSAKSDFKELHEDWKQLWQDKVIKTIPPGISVEEYYLQRAGVMAEFSKVVCISLGYFKKEKEVLNFRVTSIFDHDEKIVLNLFIETINKMHTAKKNWILAGHNIREFDVPFLCRRLLINGIAIPQYLNFQNMKPWETNLVDTFQYWRFGDYKNFTSLNLLAASLNVPSPKDDINGSMVGSVYWKENDLQRIATYCQKDIVTVANIILRFKNLPLLLNEEVIFIK